MATEWKEYELNSDSIDKISDQINEYMAGLGENTKNIQRNRLVTEELLLRIRDAYDTPVTVKVMIGRQYGRHVFKLSYNGASFDPTETDDDSNPILETIGLNPTWGYRKQQNTVSMILSGRAKRGRLFKIISAIVLAGIIGYLGLFLPEGIRTEVDKALLTPLIYVFLGLLSTFAGLMIAMTITSGVIGIGDSSTLSKIGKNVIIRFTLISFLSGIVALGMAYPFFRLIVDGGEQGAGFQISGILDMFFDILPSNPIDPFLSGNSLQIIVIGLFVGVGLLALGERTKSIRTFIQEGASLTQWLTSTVCSAVPAFVFVAFLHQIWSGNIKALLSVWRPLLIVICISAIWVTALLLYTSFRVKCSPIHLAKNIIPVFIIGITTGSSMTAFTTGMDTCEKKLGIDNSYVKFAYPLGNVMYMQGTVMYLVVISLFFAETYDIKVNLMWFALAVITSALLAIAVPPIPGAGMMLFSVLFTQLGIPAEALLMATAMDIVMDFVDTGLNLFALMLEITGGARSTKRLDYEILRKH